jgi:anti-repressor protein
MNQLQKVFNYQERPVRTILKDGEPWFVAKDVCEVLEHSNHKVAISRLDEDEVSKVYLTDALGREQETSIINEAGLYSLILSSNKPEAKAFKRWITHEVIPSIRKHGAYMTPEKIEEVLLNPDTIIQLATTLKAEQEKNRQLLLANMQKDQVIHELQPKATYYDLVLQNKTLLSVTKIAKDYGMSATALNKILAEEKVQFRQGDCWLLYQRYAERGYTQSKTQVIDEARTKLHTYWTQKGRLFIYDLLKNKRGILPVMERQQTKEGA